jgi:hypothetical protein
LICNASSPRGVFGITAFLVDRNEVGIRLIGSRGIALNDRVMGDGSFQNNVPDPLLSGKELPIFKFELEKSKGKVLGNSFGKEVTVE